MKQHMELQKAFGSTPPEIHHALERAFAKGEIQMKKRHKLMMALPIAVCLAIGVAFALAAGNHASPAPDVIAAPVPENTKQPQPAECVYFTERGNYYHAVQDCSGMTDAQNGAEAEALALGKSPCPICMADGSNPAEAANDAPNVWCTPKGLYFHADQFCSGMQNALPEPWDQAEAEGRKPCPICIPENAAAGDT